MDLRYAVAGAVITSTSIVFITYSVLSGMESALGPSLAVLALGVVVLASGLSLNEPVTELLKLYVSDMSRVISKVLEDSGILGTHRLRVCLKGLKVVMSPKAIKCSETSLGFGLVNGIPYLGLPVGLDRVVGDFASDDLRDFLTEVLSRRFRICKSVRVAGSGEEYVVELNTVNEAVYDLLKVPLNYLKVLTAVLAAKFLGRDVELVDEELVGSNYVIRLRVV